MPGNSTWSGSLDRYCYDDSSKALNLNQSAVLTLIWSISITTNTLFNQHFQYTKTTCTANQGDKPLNYDDLYDIINMTSWPVTKFTHIKNFVSALQ